MSSLGGRFWRLQREVVGQTVSFSTAKTPSSSLFGQGIAAAKSNAFPNCSSSRSRSSEAFKKYDAFGPGKLSK